MLCAATALVSATATAVAIKVSFLTPHCQLTMRILMSEKMSARSGCSSHPGRYGIMAVAMRIGCGTESMRTSGLFVCSALSVARKPPFAPPHGRGCHPDRALPVLCKVVYRHGRAASD